MSSKGNFGIQVDFNTGEEEIMSRSSYDARSLLQLSISAIQPTHPMCIHERERHNPLIFQNLNLNLML
jgi:hypothetical protein